jgi:hypothetical protein
MATNIEALEPKVMKLAIEERTRLAEKLILCLWVAEAERRPRELRAGKLDVRPR